MSKREDFVHLHVHSDLSQLDGCGKIPDYVRTAAERGNPALAITDHGTMRGYMTLSEEAPKHDIKGITGIEFYVARDHKRRGVTAEERARITDGLAKSEHKQAVRDYEEREGIRDRWHLTAWAKNDVGLRNLYQLSSAAWIDGFYYKPRIDLELLEKHHEGIILGSGCISSPINDSWVLGRKRAAVKYADRLHEMFGEDFWLEIQPHNIRDQVEANKLMVRLRKRYGRVHRLVATQDAHYIGDGDGIHHEVLLCIGSNSNMSDPDRFRFDNNEFWLKTREQMRATFGKYHPFLTDRLVKEALDSTVEIAERCVAKVEMDYHKCLLPDSGVASERGMGDFECMKALCLEGWGWRLIPERATAYAKKHGILPEVALQAYKMRLRHELTALARQKFVPYFLMIYDLYRFARSNKIMVGPGRGSIAGSLVAYLLGLSAVDPIEHGLIFERFINPDRVDMPDVDMDFEDRRRQEVIAYLRTKYGEDKVCQIATVGKLSGKQCIRDVSRVLEVPLMEVNQVTTSIIERSSGDERASQTIEDSFKDFDVCRKFNERHPDVLRHAKKLEGMAKNLGIHAAGVVASPVPLVGLIPLEIRKHNGENIVVSATDMYGVAASGLVKLDVLGLRTLSVLKETCEAVEERHGRAIDLESPADVDLDDPKVLAGFTAHDYGGVFQYDTPSADKVCEGVEFTSFEDVAAMTALNRPGTARSGLATKYVQRKKKPELVAKVDFHPKVSEITKDTLGIIVYQEHVIKIFTDIAGFAPGTADSLRKKIAKKVGDESIGKERVNFIEGAMKHTSGMTEEIAAKIIDAITFFGSYGFNKTLCESALVWKAGANAVDPRKQVSIGELARRWDEHVDGQLTPFAQKLRYGYFRIIAMDEDGRCRPVRLLAIHDHGKCKTYRIKTASGNVTPGISRAHRLMTVDGYKSIASGMGVGDKLLFMGENTERDYCSWWMTADTHFSQQGRMADGYKLVVDQVWEEAGRKCSRCGGGVKRRKGGGEVAHIRTPAECDYNHTAFHSKANLRLLCNSCHKTLDYEKGERTKRWQKGRPTFADEIVEIEDAGVERCYDLEVDNLGHNFVAGSSPEAPPVVSHNSHATAYGMIAFWGMWLKMYYPLEFYWALLKNEPDRIRVQQIAKDAKRHEVELLPPHVNISKKHFNIDGERNAIRGSLVDIKGVGGSASEAVMATQPYSGLLDFVDRIERRKCHRGVALALAKAGALDGMLPNTKWFIENIEEAWKVLTAKKRNEAKLKELYARAEAEPDFTEEEAVLSASTVNPLAFGKHPIDAYDTFISKHVKVPIVDMGSETFFKDHNRKGVYVVGVTVEIKYNQVGDFHTGALPSEEEREAMFWGARYANVNVEDASGKQNRFKFDFDIFDTCRPVIDMGIGTPVIVHATPSSFTNTLRAQFAVALEAYRVKVRDGKPLDVWEQILAGDHPALRYSWKSESVKEARAYNHCFHKSASGGVLTGVITNVKLKYDRRGQLMAFWGVLDAGNRYVEVICFASVWVMVRKLVRPGRLIKAEIERKPDRGRGWANFFSGGKIKWLKDSAGSFSVE